MNLAKRLSLAATALVALAVSVFIWNEARKEVVFLCGNFGPGVTEQSVTAQLDTGHYLRYRTEETEGQRQIIADSAITLSLYRCVVSLDDSGRVIEASVR